MKIKYYLAAFIIIAFSSVYMGCSSDSDKKPADATETLKQADQELATARAEYEKEWQKFKNDAELKISANEKKIAEHKAEMKDANKKLKTKYTDEVSRLYQKNRELKAKIAQYKYEGKNNWEEFKKSFNHDLESVGNALNDLFDKKD